MHQPQSQPQFGVRPDAFPSPVVDIKKDTRDENERKDCETENGATAMIPPEFQGPRNFMGQQDAIIEECVLPPSQVVHMTETAIMQDTTEVDTELMDTSEAAIDSDKTRLSAQQDTRDSIVGDTETEVHQDEIVQQVPEPTSNAPETGTLLVAQSTSRPLRHSKEMVAVKMVYRVQVETVPLVKQL